MTNTITRSQRSGTRPDGRVFMTADWTNLVLVNYQVPKSLLDPLVPSGCELETRDDDPNLHVISVVSMGFSNTRVFGRAVPGGEHFNEINLRFYVRQGDRHGVVFLREFVPYWTLVVGARLVYNQPYYQAEVRHQIRPDSSVLRVESWLNHGDHRGGVRLTAVDERATPPLTSMDHFLKERYWGFYLDHFGRTFRFRVWRQVWRTYPITGFETSYDPGRILSGAWRQIDWQDSLHSVLFAEGSQSTVYWPERVSVDGERGN